MITFKYDFGGSFWRDKQKRIGKNIIEDFICWNSGFLLLFFLLFLYASSIYLIDFFCGYSRTVECHWLTRWLVDLDLSNLFPRRIVTETLYLIIGEKLFNVIFCDWGQNFSKYGPWQLDYQFLLDRQNFMLFLILIWPENV